MKHYFIAFWVKGKRRYHNGIMGVQHKEYFTQQQLDVFLPALQEKCKQYCWDLKVIEVKQ